MKKAAQENSLETLNILYAVPEYVPAFNIGGPVISLSAVAEHLVNRGHKVVVYTTNSNGVEDLDVPLNQPVMVNGVEVWYFPRFEIIKKIFPFWKYFSQSVGYRYSPGLARKVRRTLTNFDLVHTQAIWAFPSLIAGRKAIQSGIPLFIHQRGELHPARLDYRSLKKRVYLELFVRPILDRATMLFALNSAEENNFQGLNFTRPCRVIPNGINVEEFTQKPDQTELEKYSIQPEQFILLFMSRMHTFKGADLLVQAFLNHAGKYPDSVLVMAGPDEQGFTSNLVELVNDQSLENRVLFPGMVSGKLKKSLLSRANLFCLPSVGEGFSMALLESLASGTPVMITPGCNFPEIKEHQAGFIVERSLDAWTNELERILQNPEQLPALGQNACNLVKKYYSWDKIVDQIEQAYNDGVGQSGRDKK